MEGFRVEQGEVLLSVQLILTREEELRRRMPARAVPAAVGSGRPPAPSGQKAASSQPRVVPSQVSRTPARTHVIPSRPVHLRPAPARPDAPSRAPIGSASTPARSASGLQMVDPLTGVGTLHALRRDLMLEQAWPGAGKPVSILVALEIEALDQIRLAMGAEAGDHVLKSLVEVAPFALRAQDRVYRSGRSQLTLMLPSADQAGAETARRDLEAALQRCLTGRGYPEVRLSARKLDAVALAS